MKSTASGMESKSTFELAFRLLDDISTDEKFSILQIIRARDNGAESAAVSVPRKGRGRQPKGAADDVTPSKKRGRKPKAVGKSKTGGGEQTRPPLKGSKAEKILELYKSGLTSAREIRDSLQQKKVNATPPEIYRVLKRYAK